MSVSETKAVVIFAVLICPRRWFADDCRARDEMDVSLTTV